MSRLRSNKVVNQAGTGAPELTYGAVVPGTGTISGAGKVSIGGSITAGSFHGDGSSLSGIDASALKDGSNTKVQAISTGANVTGNLAATGNVSGVNVSASGNVTAVDGTFSGNATVQGNLTVNGTTTTIDTAVTSVDSLAVDGDVGIGTDNTTTTGFSRTIRIKGSSTSSGVSGLFAESNNGNAWFGFYSGSSTTDTPALLYPFNGALRIGTTNSVGTSGFAERLSIKSNGDVTLSGTGSLKVPVGTTAQRPTPAAGMFRYNTTEGKFEGYTTEWGEIGGGGGLTTEAHVANNAVVTLDLTAAVDHKVTATGICTITCTGGTEAQSHTIRIINSGSATVGFSTYFLFPSGNTPVLTSTDGAINLISFTVNRVGAAGTQLLAGASLNFS